MGPEEKDVAATFDAAIDEVGEGTISDSRKEPEKDTAPASAPKPENKPAAEEPAKKDEPEKKETDSGEKPPANLSEEEVQNVLLALNVETPEEAIAKAKKQGEDLHTKSMETGTLRAENQNLREGLAKLEGRVDTLLRVRTGEVKEQSGEEESQEFSAVDLAVDPEGYMARVKAEQKILLDRLDALEQSATTTAQISEAKTHQAEIIKTMKAKYGDKVWDAYDNAREEVGKAVHFDKTMSSQEVFHLAAFGLQTLGQIRAGKSIVATKEPIPKGGMGSAATGADIKEPTETDSSEKVAADFDKMIDSIDPTDDTHFD